MEEELKRCPLCGAGSEQVRIHIRLGELPRLKCYGCGLELWDAAYRTPKQLAQAWNTRSGAV